MSQPKKIQDGLAMCTTENVHVQVGIVFFYQYAAMYINLSNLLIISIFFCMFTLSFMNMVKSGDSGEIN